MMQTSITLHLRRTYGERGTNGSIRYLGEIICHTIELPWRDNRPRISCIPEGRYRLEKRIYPKNGEQIGIPEVKGRSAILIHAANDAQQQLQGCIAPVTRLLGEGRGIHSNKALEKLKAVVYSLWDMDAEVYLEISDVAKPDSAMLK